MKHTIMMARFHGAHLSWLLMILGCHQGPLQLGVTPAYEGKYPNGEAAAVYRAVLQTLYLSGGESPPMVVLWDSAVYRQSACSKKPCQSIPAHKSPIKGETIRAYDRATRLMAPMRPDFGFDLPVHLLSEADRKGLEALGQAESDSLRKANSYLESSPFWRGFRKRYPGAWGLAVLTRVGFDADSTQALVQVMHNCGNCGHTEDMFLEKVGGHWQVSERLPMDPFARDYVDVVQRFHSRLGDGRDSLVLGPLRYLGPDARYLANTLRYIDSVRLFIKDSIERDRLPRRIRGTIRDRVTGGPIPFAEVVAHVTPNDTKIRFVSDSAGRYAINNVPIGGTMLELQCPGANGAPGKTLDAPGLYVHAAIDTVIDMTVPDLSPCWPARRIRRLHVGAVSSVNASDAADDEASAVYRSVIEALFPAAATRRQLIVISSVTRSRCVLREDCGSPQLFRLQKSGQVDSSTVMDFSRVSRDSVLFRSRLRRAAWTTIMTPAEVSYLTREGQLKYGSDDPAGAFWTAYKEAYPTSPGLVSWTRVGFNPGQTQALVEVAVETAAHRDAPPEMMLLAKRPSGWRVVRRNIDREVTSGAMRGGVCVPVTPPPHRPDSARVARLVGEFRISEIVTSRQTRLQRFSIRLMPPDPVRTRDSSAAGQPSRWPPSKFFPSVEIFNSTGEKVPELRGRFMVDRTGTELVITDGALDGYYKTLQIHRIEGDNFFGSWHSSFSYVYQLARDGSVMANPSGFFCAVRVAPVRPRR
jgi:hypothetical protein